MLLAKERKNNYIPKPKIPTPTAKRNPANDDTCHLTARCGSIRKDVPVYLAELLKKKKQVGSASSSAFKVFKNEVENSHRKIIKALAIRSSGELHRAMILKDDLIKLVELVEGFEPPQEEVIPIRRSERTHQAPNRLCLNVEAEEHKMQSMIDNKVWVLVDIPPNCKTVGSKWIYKKKTDMDGNVHTYKARLVAKGYTQLCGVDYEETFSPIADIRAIRILISIAAFYDYEIWQMDVKTSFLNGYLDDNIYMVQPEGNHIPSLQSVNDYLGKCFAMKDLGEASFILGIKIYKDRLDLNKTQGASTPEEVKRMQNVPYALAVGSSMYAVRCTRPDVAFAQNLTSRFQQNPGEPHWTAVKNTLKMIQNLRQEAEYITASEAGMEAVWIRKFILGLGEIKFLKVHTDNNLADPFTKALSKEKLTQHARSMRLRLAISFM
ncbi:retrotransposon protein, putative, ty1-copia subclass [Tanacetum coccineum]